MLIGKQCLERDFNMKKSKIKLLISINLSLIIGLMTLHSLPLINSEAAIPITISQRQLVANTVTVSSTEYPATNTPSSLENSQILLNGESLFGETLQTIATYTLSNGETYFNFKFGQRYYWINTKACVINPKLISKQSIHQPVYFVTNDYGLYNVPSTQSQAIKLIDGNQAPTTSVQAIANTLLMMVLATIISDMVSVITGLMSAHLKMILLLSTNRFQT